MIIEFVEATPYGIALATAEDWNDHFGPILLQIVSLICSQTKAVKNSWQFLMFFHALTDGYDSRHTFLHICGISSSNVVPLDGTFQAF